MGPSGLTRENEAVCPGAPPSTRRGAGASGRPWAREWPGPEGRQSAGGRTVDLGGSAHRTQGGQNGKTQGRHPGFWRVGPWVVPPAPKTHMCTQPINSRETYRQA